MIELICAGLESEGHEFVCASNADDAYARFTAKPADLVITDVHMPGRSGIDLLRDIHKDYPLTPVVIITGKASLEAAVECLKSGASDFLTKPIDFGKLKEVVEGCLKTGPDDVGTVIMPGNPSLRVIAGYRVKRTLGTGNCGVVYLAERQLEGKSRKVALKVLQDGLPAEARDRFTREAEIVARFDHPNIVRIWDFDVDENARMPYIAMEYVPGLTLKQEAARNTWDYPQCVAIIKQIGEALGTIHAAGVCHRDVKPHNVMLDRSGCVKLMDFGIVRTFDSTLTARGNLLGTPAYMAPEAFSTDPVDLRSDLFSLGIVAYELLLNELPFTGNSVTALAFGICTEKPLAPRRWDPDFPIPLADILARLLKKDPGQRYQQAADLIADLDCFMTNRPLQFATNSTDDDWT